MEKQATKLKSLYPPITKPYPVLGRALSIGFQGQGNVLPAREARGCIPQARNDLIEHIREIGDGPFEQLLFPFTVETFVGLPLAALTCNNTAAILGILSLKISQEVYFEWFAGIILI